MRGKKTSQWASKINGVQDTNAFQALTGFCLISASFSECPRIICLIQQSSISKQQATSQPVESLISHCVYHPMDIRFVLCSKVPGKDT